MSWWSKEAIFVFIVKSTRQTGDKETKTGAIAGGVVAVLIVAVIVGLAGFFFKR